MPPRKLRESRRDSVVEQPVAGTRTSKGKPNQPRSAVEEEENDIPYFHSEFED